MSLEKEQPQQPSKHLNNLIRTLLQYCEILPGNLFWRLQSHILIQLNIIICISYICMFTSRNVTALVGCFWNMLFLHCSRGVVILKAFETGIIHSSYLSLDNSPVDAQSFLFTILFSIKNSLRMLSPSSPVQNTVSNSLSTAFYSLQN